MRLTDEQVKVIKEKLNKATPGKWAWRLNPKGKSLMLISNASMMPIVMEFWRWGMHSAIAVFRDFKHDILEKADKWGIKRESHHDYNLDINHPDAQFIADASTDVRDLLDTIEALQQETVELRAEIETTKHIANAQTEAAIDYQQENEQLQAQAARMREVVISKTNDLKEIFNKMNYTGHAWMPLDEIDDFLASDAPAAYHNPADVAALKKAKEALEHCRYVIDQIAPQAIPRPTGGMQIADEALAAIAEVVEL